MNNTVQPFFFWKVQTCTEKFELVQASSNLPGQVQTCLCKFDCFELLNAWKYHICWDFFKIPYRWWYLCRQVWTCLGTFELARASLNFFGVGKFFSWKWLPYRFFDARNRLRALKIHKIASLTFKSLTIVFLGHFCLKKPFF